MFEAKFIDSAIVNCYKDTQQALCSTATPLKLTKDRSFSFFIRLFFTRIFSCPRATGKHCALWWQAWCPFIASLSSCWSVFVLKSLFLYPYQPTTTTTTTDVLARTNVLLRQERTSAVSDLKSPFCVGISADYSTNNKPLCVFLTRNLPRFETVTTLLTNKHKLPADMSYLYVFLITVL